MIEDAAKPGHPEIRSVIVDKNGRLTNDLTCPRCRYNLRGVQQDGVCPECGLAVEKAILASNDPRWTKLQIVLSILAIAYGVVLPIVNVAVYSLSWTSRGNSCPDQILVWFLLLWLFGGFVSLIAVLAALDQRFTRTCLLIMIAVLAESVIAVVINVMTWLQLIASV